MPRAKKLLTPADKLRLLKRQASREAADKVRKDFQSLCKAHGLPIPECEVEFDLPATKRRCDYLWRSPRPVILECEGGAARAGRHTRLLGFAADIDKYNRAAVLGYTVVRCLPDTIKDPKLPRLSSPQTLLTLKALLTTQRAHADPTPE